MDSYRPPLAHPFRPIRKQPLPLFDLVADGALIVHAVVVPGFAQFINDDFAVTGEIGNALRDAFESGALMMDVDPERLCPAARATDLGANLKLLLAAGPGFPVYCCGRVGWCGRGGKCGWCGCCGRRE